MPVRNLDRAPDPLADDDDDADSLEQRVRGVGPLYGDDDYQPDPPPSPPPPPPRKPSARDSTAISVTSVAARGATSPGDGTAAHRALSKVGAASRNDDVSTLLGKTMFQDMFGGGDGARGCVCCMRGADACARSVEAAIARSQRGGDDSCLCYANS